MADIVVELCPETGICSIVKNGTEKVDLMPDEVDAIRAAKGDAKAIQAIIANADDSFAGKLEIGELAQVGRQIL